MSTAARNLAGRRRPKLKVIWPDAPPTAHPFAQCLGNDHHRNPVLFGYVVTFAEWSKLPRHEQEQPGWDIIPGIGVARIGLFPSGIAEGSVDEQEYLEYRAIMQAEWDLRCPTD